MIHREHILSRHIKAWCREAIAAEHELFVFDRAPASSMFTHMREAARGIRKGTPDTLLRVRGVRPIWAELKAPGNKPSDEQEAVGDRLRSIGDYWYWTSSVAHYRDMIQLSGVQLHSNSAFLAQHHDAAIASEIEKAELKAGKLPKRLRAAKPEAPARRRKWAKTQTRLA